MAQTLLPRSRRRPVELRRPVPLPADVAAAILNEDPRGVLGSCVQTATIDGEVYAQLGVGGAAGRRVSREVRVGFGPLLEDKGAKAVPLWWEDAEHPELFPTFDGGIELRPAPEGTELRLFGSYQPPLGTLGWFADNVVGHRIVLASLEGLLSQAATRLVMLAATRSQTAPD